MNEEKDFFKTCFNTVVRLEVKNESQAIAKEVVLSEIENLQQENKQLKGNWNKSKNFLKNTRKENLEWDKKHNCEWKGYNAYSELLIKMQEIEKGSDYNE